MSTALISIICEDRPGLIAAVTGLLFDLEINLADTTFAVLGIGRVREQVLPLEHDLEALAEHMKHVAVDEHAPGHAPLAKPRTERMRLAAGPPIE